MLKPLLFAAPAVLTSLAVFGSPAAVRGQSALFELQSRPVSSLEIADGAPAGVVLDLFVTTDRDTLMLGLFDGVTPTYWQHGLGFDTMGPASNMVSNYPSLAVDSWLTTPGSTAIAGNGFNALNGQETAWFDTGRDEGVTDFQFGRLTIPTGSAANLRGQLTLKGSESFPFELTVSDSGVLDWQTFDPVFPHSKQPKSFLTDPKPPVVRPVEPPEVKPIIPVVDPPSTEVPIEAVDPSEIPAIEPIFIDLVEPTQPILTIDPADLAPRINLSEPLQSIFASRRGANSCEAGQCPTLGVVSIEDADITLTQLGIQFLANHAVTGGELLTIALGHERVELSELDQLTGIRNPTIDLAYPDLYPDSVAFDAGTLSIAPIYASTALESNTAIPEPNSAILLLLGAMGQLLRRNAA